MNDIALAARLSAAIYGAKAINDFDAIRRADSTMCGIKQIDNTTWLVLQGSNGLKDWVDNIDIQPLKHPVIGTLHRGFYENLPRLIKSLKPYLGNPIKITGHSKGAGEGAILAGLLHAQGYQVISVILFASPKSGLQDFADYMRTNVPGKSFRNVSKWLSFFGDPITNLPLYPYVETYELTSINEPPTGLLYLLRTAWHSMTLYFAGISKL